MFFDNIQDPWSSSLYEYTIKNIFVHLDDQNEEIQKAVVGVLRKASRVQTQIFIKLAKELEGKSAHPALCKSLHQFAIDKYTTYVEEVNE